MSDTKFKVGDKVVAVESKSWAFWDYTVVKGETYTVEYVASYNIGLLEDTESNHADIPQRIFELVSTFKAMKFKVENEDHCRELQEYLFSLGYSWLAGDAQKPKYLNAASIYTHSDGFLTWMENKAGYFANSPKEETVLTSHTTYNLHPVPQPEPAPETVELNGETYLKADLEAALEKLSPVEEA